MSRPPFSRPLQRLLAVLATLVTIAATATAVLTSASAQTIDHNPIGALDLVQVTSTGIEASGWAADNDSPKSALPAAIEVNGHRVTSGYVANRPRPDVARAHPSFGAVHGFLISVPMRAGAYTICAEAGNIGPGVVDLVGCRKVVVSFDPTGGLAPVRSAHGQFSVAGWAADVSAVGPIGVDISIDGTTVAHQTANLAWAGGHGFTVSHPVAQGTHRLCATGDNVGAGANRVFACQIFSLNESPYGAIMGMHQIPGGFLVYGWASDVDTSGPIGVQISADGTLLSTVTASVSVPGHPGHGFSAQILNRINAPGLKRLCIAGLNVGLGSNRMMQCLPLALNFNPTGGLDSAVQTTPGSGVTVTGWGVDPDTTHPVTVTTTADNAVVAQTVAGSMGGSHPGHTFTASFPLGQGVHTICVRAANLGPGNGPSAASCRSVSLNFSPFGRMAAARVPGSNTISASGWAIDPNTRGPDTVVMSVDGTVVAQGAAGIARTDVAKAYPLFGSAHGFVLNDAATAGEHTVCATATNLAAGADVRLGCLIVNAVHPVPPSVPTAVQAVGEFGGATVTWHAPVSDGGAPWSGYTVTAMPGAITQTVGPTATSAIITGLKPRTSYVFTVVARNVAGGSVGGASPAMLTDASPPPQTAPAPVSTSRYIRNITGAGADPAKMHAEGIADAQANPTGHGYLVLLDIGGQDQAGNGVVLSASVRWVSYANLVSDVEAYVAGYASAQKASAPVVIAVGTNNDMDVSSITGAAWARSVVNPIRAYAAPYSGITIAGADDIEPGFRAGYAASKAWLQGYLASTAAPFVFNGSADGCSWYTTGMGCNNGWSMAGLYYLAGGAGSTRIVNLPQIYNTTMAAQWKYISLTGVAGRQPRINFGGALTEWTACSQSGGCGSLTGHEAWQAMWNQLQSAPQLKIPSLPYSTDLRIDR